LPLELREAYIPDGLCQTVVLEHSADVQIFDDQHRLGFRQPGGDLMQGVAALVAYLPMELRQPADGLLAVLAAFLSPTHHPLETFELLQTPFQVARIGDDLSIGEGRQMFDTQIDAHHWAGILWDGLLLFHLHRHIPVSRLLTDRGREDLDLATGWQILPFFEA
jgi:hypothetical protein